MNNNWKVAFDNVKEAITTGSTIYSIDEEDGQVKSHLVTRLERKYDHNYVEYAVHTNSGKIFYLIGFVYLKPLKETMFYLSKEDAIKHLINKKLFMAFIIGFLLGKNKNKTK